VLPLTVAPLTKCNINSAGEALSTVPFLTVAPLTGCNINSAGEALSTVPFLTVAPLTGCNINSAREALSTVPPLTEAPLTVPSFYGVATISRLLKMIGLFCRISSLL